MDSFKLKNQRVKYDFPVGYVQEYLTVTSEAYSVRKSSKSSFRCVDCLCRCGNVTQDSLLSKNLSLKETQKVSVKGLLNVGVLVEQLKLFP